MIKLIIFDYDGVIVDSFQNVFQVYKTICKKLNKRCSDNLEDFKKVYGNSSSECYDQLGFSEDERVEGNKIFKEEILKKKPRLFKGIKKVLETLHKKYKIALLSSSYKEEVQQKLKNFNIQDNFDFILAREADIGRFEKTDSIIKIIEDLGLKTDEIILIGDRNIDFLESSKAGLTNIILVDYGWGYNLDLIKGYKKKVNVKKPLDLLDAINKHF